MPILSPNRLDERVIRGYTQANAADLLGARANTRRERTWLKELSSGRGLYFPTNDELHRAVASEQLVQVLPTDTYRPATRFLNPALHDDYPPFLRRDALMALNDLAGLWRHIADGLGVPANIRLSVASLSRTEEYQEGLVAAGKLAVMGSSHTAGLAFDIDRSGYYVVDDEGVRAVSLRPPEYHVAVGGLLRGLAANQGDWATPVVAQDIPFDWRVPVALEQAAAIMESAGAINPVYEFNDTQSACLHVGVHPDYLQLAA